MRLAGQWPYLNHVLFFVEFPQRLASSQLEQGDFGRNEPAEEVSEDNVVSKWNDVLNFPENGPTTNNYSQILFISF